MCQDCRSDLILSSSLDEISFFRNFAHYNGLKERISNKPKRTAAREARDPSCPIHSGPMSKLPSLHQSACPVLLHLIVRCGLDFVNAPQVNNDQAINSILILQALSSLQHWSPSSSQLLSAYAHASVRASIPEWRRMMLKDGFDYAVECSLW